MLGRFLGLAAVIAAVSVGMAGIAGRSTNLAATGPVVDRGGDDNENWTTQRGKDRSAYTTAQARASSGGVRINRSGDSHFYATAEIDGVDIKMMVDSGASIIALTRRDAETIGIDVDSLPVSGTARTAGGDVPMRTVMLDSVDIDGIEVRRVQAAVVDADMGVSLLGQSYLARLAAVNVEGDTMTLR
ncbi:retropepsin-like aspartic protease family protein [Sphingopyxis macrogoltabida]|uniref:Aspartyl protease n=1 Tax=Sphingopyxis macrogoltabida TaxID=33050 RepID=A0AAC9AVR3_SPHMC|nr:retropepsin-like aspartic protease [Sphingopyxis macrogoltabida]ALJ14203.1 aspartyl protease [Sphingopyxis macrogoltabida]AMU90468.1 aspartyl protease [Sphingopyxis macrogoltabida]